MVKDRIRERGGERERGEREREREMEGERDMEREREREGEKIVTEDKGDVIFTPLHLC